MARAQTIAYNGIILSLTYTNSVVSRAVYSPDGVDYLWTEFTIDIDCILNPQETAYAILSSGQCGYPVESPGTLPMDTFTAIRHTLMQPRQQLLSAIFGENILAVGATPDANNGPIPLACTLRKIVGGQVFYFNFVIKTCLIECPCPVDSPLISNRYSQSQTINREMYTEVTTTGEAYFRTDFLTAISQTADAFRSQVLPILPLYFHRDRVRFNINSAGNTISYEVTDVEKQYDLGDTGPNGSQTFITNFEGSYNVATLRDANGGIQGGMQMATINVKLWGGKPASRWVLIQTAFQIISTQVQFVNQSTILRNVSITKDLAINYVDVTVTAQLAPILNGAGNLPAAGMQIQGLTKDQSIPDFNGINPNLYQAAGSAGSINEKLLSSALQDACFTPQVLNPDGTTETGQAPPQQGPPPQTQQVPTNILPPTTNQITPEQTMIPYTRSRIESEYDTDMGNIQVPKGAPNKTPYSPPVPPLPPVPATQDPPPAPPTPPPFICPPWPFGSDPVMPGQPLSQYGTSTVITVSNPTTRRRVRWSCERFGGTPQIPSPILNDPNQVLLGFKISPVSMTVLEDSTTPAFRVDGEYIYALLIDMTQVAIIPFDTVQWIDYPYGSYNIDTRPNSFNSVHGLIDCANTEEPV